MKIECIFKKKNITTSSRRTLLVTLENTIEIMKFETLKVDS